MADINKELNPHQEHATEVPSPEAEKAFENAAEKKETETAVEIEKSAELPPVQKKSHFLKRQPALVLPATRDPLALKVEKILEENVGDAYSRLSPIAQQEFKLKGEAVALKITELLKSTHVKVKKIFQLILEWLKMLPGVNRFFLEQEAKIKTDRIVALHKKL